MYYLELPAHLLKKFRNVGTDEVFFKTQFYFPLSQSPPQGYDRGCLQRRLAFSTKEIDQAGHAWMHRFQTSCDQSM